MTAKVFGEGLNRVGVREIVPDVFWLTHCLGDLAKDIYADYFALLPNPEAYVSDRVVDYPFSAFLFRDERSCLIDTIGPAQRESVMAALDYVLDIPMCSSSPCAAATTTRCTVWKARS